MTDGLMQDTMITMNWTEVAAHADKQSLVLLPLGVVEEHGPHLCLGTDILTAHLYCLASRKSWHVKGIRLCWRRPFTGDLPVHRRLHRFVQDPQGNRESAPPRHPDIPGRVRIQAGVRCERTWRHRSQHCHH